MLNSMMATGIMFHEARMVSEMGTILPVIFSIRLRLDLGVASRSGTEPENPMCQMPNELYAAAIRSGKSDFRCRLAISRARKPPTMRPNPQLIQPARLATKAVIMAPFTGVVAMEAIAFRTRLTGGVRARQYPVTRIRIICMAKAMMP
ncbi:MAG: hypothetical protein A4E73_00613 [Syntrophaceae bacterium PtaU1.Bin231]|nr:MAG: hypothetical protein A4E73_00613 [Syntrophaceae bacterium PtaU1.Bin231]